LAEISKFYGSSCTPSSLQNHFTRVINPDLKLIKAAVSAGNDPEQVQLSYIKKIDGGSGNGQEYCLAPNTCVLSFLSLLLLGIY